MNNTRNQQTIAQFIYSSLLADLSIQLILDGAWVCWDSEDLEQRLDYKGFKIRRQSIGINQGINGLYKMLYLEDYLESKSPYLDNMWWLIVSNDLSHSFSQ